MKPETMCVVSLSTVVSLLHLKLRLIKETSIISSHCIESPNILNSEMDGRHDGYLHFHLGRTGVANGIHVQSHLKTLSH